MGTMIQFVIGENVLENWKTMRIFIDLTWRGIYIVVVIDFWVFEPATVLEWIPGDLQQFLPDVRAVFFFTERKVSQISAIKSVNNIDPSLCLCHINRALETKY